MHLYDVRVDAADGDAPSKTWLVVASDRSEACRLVPSGRGSRLTVESVRDIPSPHKRRPGVIGWAGSRLGAVPRPAASLPAG